MTDIAYDDVGSGTPVLVCLPGWCGDRTVFEPLLPLLSTDRRTLVIDLPDQGGSRRRADDFSAAEVVGELIALLDEAGVEQVVPVALAHAGWLAIELRRRLGPDRVPAIVFIDWMVLGTPPGFDDALRGMQVEESWEQVRSGLFAMWTTGVDVPAVHDYVSSMGEYGFRYWRRAAREISASFTAEGSPLAALERLDVPCPTLHVYAQPPDETFLAAQQDFAAQHPWFRVHHLDAHSHFPMYEVPDDIADQVQAFLSTPR